MTRYSIEQIKRKYIKEYGFLSFARNRSYKYEKQLMDTATKARLDALKTPFKKVVHKASEATGEFIGNEINDKIVEPKLVPNENTRDVDKIVILPEKKKQQKTLNE